MLMTKRKHRRLLLIGMLGTLVLAVGCAGAAPPPTVQPMSTTEPTAVPVEPTVTVAVEPTVTSVEEEVDPVSATEPAPTAEPTVEPVPTAEPTEEPLTIEPIEVTYFTPSQAEGPYYPVNKPVDVDNDLVVLAGAGGTPAGSILDLSGKIYDATGMPLSGLLIEIWQTDDNGIYDHPGDPTTDERDRNFQFYGETITAVDGSFAFRTIFPGKYEPRPVHIHYKVKADGQELLTSQMYFEGDPDLEADGIFAGSGDGAHMIVTITEGQDEAGNLVLRGSRDVVLRAELPAYYPDVESSD